MRTTSLLSIVSIFIASLTAAQAGGIAQLLKAKVSGTVQTQQVLGGEEGKIKTTAVNNQRIFDEFGVDAKDYELVLAVSDTGLYLIPRNEGSGLSTIPVVRFGSSSGTIIDTKKRAVSYIAPAQNTTATSTLFENFTGTATGLFRFNGTWPAADFKGAVVNVVGRGTDSASEGGSGTAIMKLKITTSGDFAQEPGPIL